MSESPTVVLTKQQLQRQLLWMVRATSYAMFIPPGLGMLRRRRLLRLLSDVLLLLEPTTVRPKSLWEFWNHPLRAGALLMLRGLVERLASDTTECPWNLRHLMEELERAKVDEA